MDRSWRKVRELISTKLKKKKKKVQAGTESPNLPPKIPVAKRKKKALTKPQLTGVVAVNLALTEIPVIFQFT